MIAIVPLAIVVAAGLFFVAFGGASLVAPARAQQFLLGFASSSVKHYVELSLRFFVGGAFVLSAPRMIFPGMFTIFGWVLLGTTVGLLLIPWHWHHRFARWSVPQALRFLPIIGVSSVLLGGLVLWAVFRGNAV